MEEAAKSDPLKWTIAPNKVRLLLPPSELCILSDQTDDLPANHPYTKFTVAVLNEDLEVDYRVTRTGAQSEAADFAKHCRKRAKRYVEQGYHLRTVMHDLAACMEEGAAELIHANNEETAFESQIRLSISAELENHTCAEEGRETTAAKEIRQWLHGGTIRDVHVLHDRPASQIHVLKNFISEEECQAIQDAARPKLQRGTVADGKGGHTLSDHRKAWQAGIRVPWEKEADGDLIARVLRRLYDYTNHAVEYNLTVEGQEDLMSIQYFGMGKDSNLPPDQYRPHCDGECDGLPHKTGGRVATMVMYCDVPEIGGATNFQNSGVFVRPELGAAAFFSYMDPVAKRQENGFTSHSGCPVIEGTKRIAVQWMRIGVDNKNPWDSFNTLTIKKSQANSDDC